MTARYREPEKAASDLAAVFAEVTGQDGTFGHRQHVHLAFLAARQYGPESTPDVLCGWIRQIAAAHGAAGKFHATITIAWARAVAHHAAEDLSVASFDDFAARHPALLDKHLLDRHYRPATLASAAARSGWVPPDASDFPWAA